MLDAIPLPEPNEPVMPEVMPEVVPPEVVSSNGVAPSVTVKDGQLEIDWPTPKPAAFMITAEVFEQLVTNINLQRRTITQAKKIFTDLGKVAAKMS